MRLLTPRQISERFQISEHCLRTLIRQGKIPVIQFTPRVVRFDPEALELWRKQFYSSAVLNAGENRPPDSSAQQAVTLTEAFNTTLRNANRREASRQDWRQAVRRFMRWLSEKHPGLDRWHMLTRHILREYLATMDGKSATTRRLAIQPIRQTAGFMHREFGFANFAEKMGISSKLAKPPASVYLPDVISFLDHLRNRTPRLEAGAALQGLAGLQLQEATRLTWDKVDLVRGLIEISGEVKNDYRNRVIPVCRRCLDALQRASQLHRPSESHPDYDTVLITRTSKPHGKWWASYSRDIRKGILAWNPEITWKPKDLRNCLPTFAITQGIYNPVWEQYVGHAPRTVTERHYLPRLGSISDGESEALEKQMEVFRRHVVAPLDDATESGALT